MLDLTTSTGSGADIVTLHNEFHLLTSTILVHKAPFRLDSKCIVLPLYISVGMLGNAGVQYARLAKPEVLKQLTGALVTYTYLSDEKYYRRVNQL